MEESKQLLEKLIAGTCTEDERQAVNMLLNSDEGRQLLDNIIEEHELITLDSPVETDPAKDTTLRLRHAEIQQRVSDYEKSRRPFLSRPFLRYTGIAAAFIGVVVLSSVFLLNNNNGTGLFGNKEQIAYAELTNPDGIPELHELPDGTQIWLAAGSTLKYPQEFDKKHRDVELTGEAFFDVERDEKCPFTIHSGEMETRVLGTSFKVTAFAGQEQEVSVATGKVSVSSNGQELALLTRGLQVRHNPETGETIQAEIDPTALEEWKSGTLIFDELPMNLVAEQLENRFGITIEFTNPKMETHRVRATFAPEDGVETILEFLVIAENLNYKNTDNKHYTIY